MQELRRQYAADPERTTSNLIENLREGRFKPDNFSLRDLFEATARDSEGRLAGRDLLYEISFRRSGGDRRALREAAQAVSTGDFSNITGQIIYNKIRESYTLPKFLWPDLCTTQQTEFLYGERIPGVGRIGDKAEQVEEGMQYPFVGLNEQWTDTAATVKRGFIIPISREIIVYDRTGLVTKLAGEGGDWLGVNKEKQVLDLAVGVKNNYNRNGVSTNTYLTSGAYINDQTGNALSGAGNEWLALQNADLLFAAMTDPNTGEPIGIPDNIQLLVPYDLFRSARRIVTATDVEHVDMRQQASTIRTIGRNPYGDRQPQILTNQWVKTRSNSGTKWYYGDFKAALLWMSVWDIETTQAAPNNPLEFTNDIWAQHKVSYRGVGQMYEPRKLTRNDQ